jgi:hypothetical protein
MALSAQNGSAEFCFKGQEHKQAIFQLQREWKFGLIILAGLSRAIHQMYFCKRWQIYPCVQIHTATQFRRL